MERPLYYSWILPERLAVGERPRSFAELQHLGFAAVLSLQEESEPGPEGAPPAGFVSRLVGIRDGIVEGVPSPEQFREAVEVLAGFLGKGLRTYVHCYAGVGRSPTICMGYLARSENLSLGEAYRRVVALHEPTAPTAGQLAVLAQFLADLREERGR